MRVRTLALLFAFALALLAQPAAAQQECYPVTVCKPDGTGCSLTFECKPRAERRPQPSESRGHRCYPVTVCNPDGSGCSLTTECK